VADETHNPGILLKDLTSPVVIQGPGIHNAAFPADSETSSVHNPDIRRVSPKDFRGKRKAVRRAIQSLFCSVEKTVERHAIRNAPVGKAPESLQPPDTLRDPHGKDPKPEVHPVTLSVQTGAEGLPEIRSDTRNRSPGLKRTIRVSPDIHNPLTGAAPDKGVKSDTRSR